MLTESLYVISYWKEATTGQAAGSVQTEIDDFGSLI